MTKQEKRLNNENHNQERKLELGNKLLNYFESKYLLSKDIKEEISNPNSVFASGNKVGIQEFRKRIKEKYRDLLQGDTTIDRVIDRLSIQVPKFYERKNKYQKNSKEFFVDILKESLSSRSLDLEIIDHLQNINQMQANFDNPPNIEIILDGQFDSHLLQFGNIKELDTLEISGFYVPASNIVFVEKNTGTKNNTPEHETYHSQTSLQSNNGTRPNFGMQHTLFYSTIEDIDNLNINEEDFKKIANMYVEGGLMMEELLASFVQGEQFSKDKLKDYFVQYIGLNSIESFSDIPHHKEIFDNLENIRIQTLNALDKLLIAYKENFNLSDKEAKQLIAEGLSIYYDGSTITKWDQIPKRPIKTKNIPEYVDIIINAMNQRQENSSLEKSKIYKQPEQTSVRDRNVIFKGIQGIFGGIKNRR